MWSIHYKGQTIPCADGENLRQVLKRAGLSLYNDRTGLMNCRGLGTCGTCAVEISGKVSPPTRVEKWRLGFPPHQKSSRLRLACQCCVRGNLAVVKHPGFWGQRGGAGGCPGAAE